MKNKENFIPANIDISVQHFSVEKVIKMILSGDLILDKNFRRSRNNEWTQEEKSCLIESIIIQIPIGNFYFEMTHDGKYMIIDGWKRLNALSKFVELENDNIERFNLKGLKYIEKYEGSFFKDLPPFMCRRILEKDMNIYMIKSWVPEEIKDDIANRIS